LIANLQVADCLKVTNKINIIYIGVNCEIFC